MAYIRSDKDYFMSLGYGSQMAEIHVRAKELGSSYDTSPSEKDNLVELAEKQLKEEGKI